MNSTRSNTAPSCAGRSTKPMCPRRLRDAGATPAGSIESGSWPEWSRRSRASTASAVRLESLRVEEQVHVEAIAAIRRDASRRRVRLLDESFVFEPGEDAADGGGRHAQAGGRDEHGRGDRFAGRDVFADERREHAFRAIVGLRTSVISYSWQSCLETAKTLYTGARWASSRARRRARRPRSPRGRRAPARPSSHQHLAVHDGRAHVGCSRGVDDASSTGPVRARGAADRDRSTMRSARLPASIDPMSASSPSVRAPARVAIHERVARRQRAGPASRRLQQRGEAHLVEHVEVVVAGRAVGAERHGDAARPHRRRPARCPIPASGSSSGSAAP